MIVGAFLFHRGMLERHLAWHHRLGNIYLVSVLASGLAALSMATNSFAGTVADWGFGTLGVCWLVSSGVLVLAMGSLESAFRVVSSSCWVPNLVFAEWWLARRPGTGGVAAN